MSDRPVRVFIGLGSNLEPKEAFLRSAVTSLQSIGAGLKVSPVYETKPVGNIAQPEFLNAVVEMTTKLAPLGLLHSLKQFERELGRQVRPRWHEREIDFDILFYNDLVLVSSELQIPHPEIEHRAFVLLPMADLDLTFVHPVSHRTIGEMIEHLDLSGVVRTTIQLS